jgi:hypothetical protein
METWFQDGKGGKVAWWPCRMAGRPDFIVAEWQAGRVRGVVQSRDRRAPVWKDDRMAGWQESRMAG